MGKGLEIGLGASSALQTSNGVGSEMLAADATGWEDQANCSGISRELFIPAAGASELQAKEVCKNCVALAPCLEGALSRDTDGGVLGGMSDAELQEIRQQRAQITPENS